MKARIQIFLFVFRRFTLVIRLFFNHLKNWELRLRIHKLELEQKDNEYGNAAVLSFKQEGTIGILINNYSQALLGSSGSINIPKKLLDSNELSITFFSFLRVRTYQFVRDPTKSIYVRKTMVRFRLKLQSWKASTPTPSFDRIFRRKIAHLVLPNIKSFSTPKLLSDPLLNEISIKPKVNFESLHEQLKAVENE